MELSVVLADPKKENPAETDSLKDFVTVLEVSVCKLSVQPIVTSLVRGPPLIEPTLVHIVSTSIFPISSTLKEPI